MIFTVKHKTEYKYGDSVSFCHNLATLKPRKHPAQELLDFNLKISPKPEKLREVTDFFGNTKHHFSIQQSHKGLVVETFSRIHKKASIGQEVLTTSKVNLEQIKDFCETLSPSALEARQYVLESPLLRKIPTDFKIYAKESIHPKRPLLEACNELMERIFKDFEFVSGFTDVSTPVVDAFAAKKGVCQDFAHIAIACLRSQGVPARYMSGYIETLPPEGEEKLQGVDASHAWFACAIPGLGWVEFDPTNNIIPGEQHLVCAWGRDYSDVAPLKGVVYTTGQSQIKVSVDIARENQVETTENHQTA